MVFSRSSTSCLGITTAFSLIRIASGQIPFDLFSYNPGLANGPQNWANIALDGNVCNGVAQSGINVPSQATCDSTGGVTLQNGDCLLEDVTFFIDPHSVATTIPATANCTAPSLSIAGDDHSYTMFEWHIHSISEHSIDGRLTEAEMHISHTTEDPGHFGAIALMISGIASEPNAVFQEWLDLIAVSESNSCANSTARRRQEELNGRRLDMHEYAPYSLIPSQSAFYQYEGSLTTPPCSEVVTWLVAEERLLISAQQMATLRALINTWENPDIGCQPGSIQFMNSTARPTQPLNGRQINRICSLPPASTDVPVTETVPAPVPVPVPAPVPALEPVFEPVPTAPVPVPAPSPMRPTATLPPVNVLVVPEGTLNEWPFPGVNLDVSGASANQFVQVAALLVALVATLVL